MLPSFFSNIFPPLIRAVDEVVLKINRDEVEDYLAASQFVNQNFDILSIEHEFGQFGGPEVGGHLFPFLKRIRSDFRENPAIQLSFKLKLF